MDNSDNPISDDDAAKSAAPSKISLIKIKFPKKEEAAAAAAAAVEEVKSHYCKECNKCFHSGKALGGHMSSAHVQANKDYSYKKLSSKRKLSGSYSRSDFTCVLCGRAFHSEKSLFGHMRCHPERLWRGMVPPVSKIDASASAAEASSEEEDDGADDSGQELGFNLKGWPTSNKRGRGPITNNPDIRAHDSGSENKGSESFVAGLKLIKMLKGDSTKQENGPKPDLEKQESNDDIESSGKGKEKLPESQDSDSSNGIDPNDELFITAIQVLVSGKRENNNEKRAEEEKAAAAAAEIVLPSPEKYKCSECGRFFPTHQALGGHRSSHNKFKLTVVNTNGLRETPRKKREKKSAAKSNDGGGDGAMAFAFDLNMEPAEEEEEEDSSNHTASSNSY